MDAWKMPRAHFVAFAAVLAFGVSPACAASRTHNYEMIPWPDGLTALHFRASNGYRIEVTDTGHRSISLTAQKGSAAATYQVRGESTKPGGIDATFPGVARIRVAFHPLGAPRRGSVPDNCRGKGNSIRDGFFVGTIRFAGERHYASVRLGRARGEVIAPQTEEPSCDNGGRGQSKEGSGGFHVTSLISFTAAQPSTRGLFVTNVELPGEPQQTGFTASTASRRGKMWISRYLTVQGGARSMAVSGDGTLPNLVKISPPAPFEGTATYERTSQGGATWSGSLMVEFPGTGPVRLAGPRFFPELCVDQRYAPGRSETGGSTIVVGR